MVTCEHVVRDAVKDNKGVTLYHYPAFEGETVSEGKKSAKGEIIATDKKLDLALLRSSGRLPCFLKLEDKEKLDDSEPLRIWSWPGWTAWEKAVVDVLDAIEEGKKLGVIR